MLLRGMRNKPNVTEITSRWSNFVALRERSRVLALRSISLRTMAYNELHASETEEA